jgi:hypothetical protein
MAAEHLIQLFDEAESLADAVASFVRDGIRHGQPVLLVIRPLHWALAVASLGLDASSAITDALKQKQLIVLDAETTLRGCLKNGKPDSLLFDEYVGARVRRLLRDGRGLRIYGEMVDLLALEMDFQGAQQLETLWNQLEPSQPYTLLCGYLSARFGDPRHTRWLNAICAAHTRVETAPADRLGAWLVSGVPTLG